MAEPLDVIGTAEQVPFEDFVAASSARLFAAALLLCEQRPAAEELLRDVLARACRRWARISRSADPEARVHQMLVDSAHHRGQPRTTSGTRRTTEEAGVPPAGLMDAVRHRHRRYQRRLLWAGSVLAAVVAAVAVGLVVMQGSLATHRPRENLTKMVVSGISGQPKIVSCVDAWRDHEARILCARYAGPPTPQVVIWSPQLAGAPAPCAAEYAMKAGC